MITEFDDDTLRMFLQGTRSEPLQSLREIDDRWLLGTFSIFKRRLSWNDGWTHSLRSESRLYKRRFEFADLAKSGWAIIFRIYDPEDEHARRFETFPGWVPLDREADADRWIEFLNRHIRDSWARQ
jgi:hypothetical protein